jgi:hypothetical protein
MPVIGAVDRFRPRVDAKESIAVWRLIHGSHLVGACTPRSTDFLADEPGPAGHEIAEGATDPDVQDYRFRFFMEELRSRMLSLTPSLTRRSRKSRR